MTYTLVKISSYYREFLERYYYEYPHIAEQPYTVQYVHLMDQGVSWADWFKRYFEKRGVEAHEIVYNAHPLQNRWAIESGLNLKGKDLLFAQLQMIRPDVVFFQDTLSFDLDFLNNIRKTVDSVKIIAGHVCSVIPPGMKSYYRSFDILFACPSLHYNILKSMGVESRIFHHAFEPSLLSKEPVPRDIDVFFAGSMIPGHVFHNERIRILNSLVRKGIDVQIRSNILRESWVKYLIRKSSYYAVRIINGMGGERLTRQSVLLKKLSVLGEAPTRYKLPGSLKPKINQNLIFGKEMIKELQRARIGLNAHGGVAGEFAANVRMFEVTGAGALLLTDRKKNIEELFTPGTEIMTYESENECVEKVRWLMDHPERLDEIASAGQARTLRDHTIEKRVEELHDIFTKRLNSY